MNLANTLGAETYQHLRQLAAGMLRQEKPNTLQPTALVHEALMRLHESTSNNPKHQNKRYFFACASEAMRRILIDKARKRKAVKHGGTLVRVPLDEVSAKQQSAVDLEALNAALDELEKHDPEAAELVRLRFFVGMTMRQSAVMMDQSLRATQRLWSYAKTWLYEKLENSSKKSGGV